MKALVTYSGTYLKPCFSSDNDEIKRYKFKVGEMYQIEISKPRNVLFHRKYFALLNLVFENQEYFTDFNALRSFVIIKSGYYIRTVTKKGVHFEPKSISFASMDQVEFDKLFDKTLDFIIAEFLPLTKDEIKAEIAEFY